MLVDTRGLLCPEPLLLVKQEMSRLGGKGKMAVLVDSGAAKENISRLAQNQGWEIAVDQQEGFTRLILTK
jgi:TusA-related sulfurtransferase